MALLADQFLLTAGVRAAQPRLLCEADFVSVTVTGRCGDQGIDGIGIYRVS